MPLVIVRYPKPSIHSVQCFLREKNDLVSKVFFVSSAFLLREFACYFSVWLAIPTVDG